MAKPLVVALPPRIELSSGDVIRLDALDAATGNEVAGVNVSNVTFEVETEGSYALDEGRVLLLRQA